MIDFKILSKEELFEKLNTLPKWRDEHGKLKAEFIFKDFRQAFAFMSKIAVEAERINHHPEWSNVYNKVSFVLSTHDAGNKITDLDVEMATFISESAKLFVE